MASIGTVQVCLYKITLFYIPIETIGPSKNNDFVVAIVITILIGGYTETTSKSRLRCCIKQFGKHNVPVRFHFLTKPLPPPWCLSRAV